LLGRGKEIENVSKSTQRAKQARKVRTLEEAVRDFGEE
jgi:hypothetical protein